MQPKTSDDDFLREKIPKSIMLTVIHCINGQKMSYSENIYKNLRFKKITSVSFIL